MTTAIRVVDRLQDLADVDFPTFADGDVAVWDAAAGKFKGVPAVAGGVTVLHVNTTPVGNVGAGEDDLMAWPMPGGTLPTDGKGVRITAWGTYGANGNVKAAKMYFGATQVGTYNDVTSMGAWFLQGVVLRTGAATQEAHGWGIPESATAPRDARTTPGETLSGAVTIKCTGTGVANDDIVQRGLIVELL